MRLEVDSGNIRRTFSPLSMALTAQFPAGRFFSPNEFRVNPMLLRNGMAPGAGQGGMRRNHLDIGNVPVAGAALFRGMGQKRIVRIMTGHAGPAGIMLLRYNLREAGGAGRVIAVAEWTKAPSLGNIRFVSIRRVHMRCCRPMAYLTGHSFVAGLLFKLVHIGVAINAGFETGISQPVRTNLVNYLGPVMPQLAKSVRY